MALFMYSTHDGQRSGFNLFQINFPGGFPTLPLHTNETYCPSFIPESGKSAIILSGLADGPRTICYIRL
jgi:hypothetical protein